MSQTITITVEDYDMDALEFAVVDPTQWVADVVSNRSHHAKKEIADILIQHCNENEIQIAIGLNNQVNQAYSLGLVQTAAQRQADVEAAEEAE
jgi:hypothetical protein